MHRRHVLQAGAAAALAPWARLSLAAGPVRQPGNHVVFVILRGGLDGLSAVPAVGDPAHADARGALALMAGTPLPLDGLFALNP